MFFLVRRKKREGPIRPPVSFSGLILFFVRNFFYRLPSASSQRT